MQLPKRISCKHYGRHSSLLEPTDRNKEAEYIARSFPRVAQESFVHQKVQQRLQENYFCDAV